MGSPHPQRGSQHVAHDVQAELAFLGIEPSPAFVREPEGKGGAERFIRTLKEDLLWARRFTTIDELRQALHAFKDTCNRTWIVERHGYQILPPPSAPPSSTRFPSRHDPATRYLKIVDGYTGYRAITDVAAVQPPATRRGEG